MEIAGFKRSFKLLKWAECLKDETGNNVFSRQDKDGIMLLGTMLLFQCCEKYWQLYFAALQIITRSLIKEIKN